MTQHGCTSAGSMRHRRTGQQKKSSLLMMLAILASVLMPLAARAEAPNPLCAGCHNEDGNSTTPEFPKIAGLDAAYITKQIIDFKKYKRVSEIMGPMAAQITDAEIPKIAAYYSAQKRTPGVAADPNLAAQGRQIFEEGILSTAVPACSGCHGEKGEGTDKFPRLAGQHAAYMLAQMINFKNVVRNNDSRGVMRAITLRMTEQEMKAAAEYISGLKGE